ncbi:hypothetical protein H8R17_03970 [Streptomyces sp. TRM68367]|nr:hypothetical protein [Streptomyces sp. TRM68367]MBC9724177.1 hypothetical protein [Streptomyces sp. TRM68367]
MSGTAAPGQDGLTRIRTPGLVPPSAGGLRVPIRVGDEEFGEPCPAGRRRPFTAEDERLLRVLANRAGIAIGNARSVSRCPRTATASPATCTTWSSSGCSTTGRPTGTAVRGAGGGCGGGGRGGTTVMWQSPV